MSQDRNTHSDLAEARKNFAQKLAKDGVEIDKPDDVRLKRQQTTKEASLPHAGYLKTGKGTSPTN